MAFGAEHSRQRDYKKFKDFHAQYKKSIVSFLNEKLRDERVCTTVSRVTDFVAGMLQRADNAAKAKEVIHVIMDTEGDYIPPGSSRLPQPYFWHKVYLCQQCVPESAIKDREREQEMLAKEFSAIKNPKTRRNRRA